MKLEIPAEQTAFLALPGDHLRGKRQALFLKITKTLNFRRNASRDKVQNICQKLCTAVIASAGGPPGFLHHLTYRLGRTIQELLRIVFIQKQNAIANPAELLAATFFPPYPLVY